MINIYQELFLSPLPHPQQHLQHPQRDSPLLSSKEDCIQDQEVGAESGVKGAIHILEIKGVGVERGEVGVGKGVGKGVRGLSREDQDLEKETLKRGGDPAPKP